MDAPPLDCIVIGAGPAGLSASLFLARYHRRVLTFHHNSPRNLYSHGVHGFLGHHGILPHELLERGRSEVRLHGGTILEACVHTVRCREDGLFEVGIGDPTEPTLYAGHRLVLATGLRDLTPTCGGFREFYGRSVHHCPDCDAYEHTGQHIAVLGNGRRVVGFALGLRTWSERLTILTDGPSEISKEHRKRLDALGIPVVEHRVDHLEGDTGVCQLERVCFHEGEPLLCEALFFTLGTEPASDLHVQLGCATDPDTGLVLVDGRQQTNVTGVYAAGDMTPHSQLAVVAAAEGAMAGIHVHRSLLTPDQVLS